MPLSRCTKYDNEQIIYSLGIKDAKYRKSINTSKYHYEEPYLNIIRRLTAVLSLFGPHELF